MEVNADQATTVLDAINSLSPAAMVFLIIAAVFGIVFSIIYFAFQIKMYKLQNSLPQKIDKIDDKVDLIKLDMVKSQKGMENEIKNRLDNVAKTISGEINKMSVAQQSNVDKMVSILQEMLDRQKGVIDTQNSVRIINLTFDGYVKQEMIELGIKSIKNNHFKGHEHFVQDKVMSALNKIMVSALNELKSYGNLSINISNFFLVVDMKTKNYLPITINELTNEFHYYDLVVRVWKLIHSSHLLKESLDMERRIEELKFNITKAVDIYLQTTMAKAMNIFSYDDEKEINYNRQPSYNSI